MVVWYVAKFQASKQVSGSFPNRQGAKCREVEVVAVAGAEEAAGEAVAAITSAYHSSQRSF